MKTARQPTTRTWFLFAFLFGVSLAIPYDRVFGPNLNELHDALTLRVVGALVSAIPLLVLLALGIFIRRTIWIALLAFFFRCFWFPTVYWTAESLPFAQQDWLALSLWPELLCFPLVLNLPPLGVGVLVVVAICGIAYSVIAILLAKSCHLRAAPGVSSTQNGPNASPAP